MASLMIASCPLLTRGSKLTTEPALKKLDDAFRLVIYMNDPIFDERFI